MAGRLLTYRAAVIASLATLPQLRTVNPHAGIFNAASLQRLSLNTPAALVAIVNARALKRNNVGQFIGPVATAVYCVDKDPGKTDSWGPALELAEIVADHIELNTFGLDYVAAARVRDLDVLYSPDVDGMGLCIAGVMFEQEVTFGRNRHREDELAGFPLGDVAELEEWPEGLGL